MHGVGDGVEEVHQAKEPHEAPALQLGVEHQVHHHRGAEDADHQPGLELAVAAAGALDDVAHDGVVQRVKDPGRHHDGGDGGELGRGEKAGKQHKGQKLAGKQVIDHVPANGAQGE